MSRFTGRSALVTGGTSDIGVAIADRLAAEGAELVLIDLDERVALDVAARIADRHGVAVSGIEADLSTKSGADDAIRAALSELSAIDVLINNAGGGVILPTLEHSEETIRTTIDRNLWTTIWCTVGVLPDMVRNGYGRVVNVGAESVRNGLFDHAIYNAAKGGVHAMCSGLAREFADKGITFNSVAPSIVMTEMVRQALESEDPRAFHRAVDLIPIGRPATVEEVASAVAYLASDEASFITGQVMSVNGGSSMG